MSTFEILWQYRQAFASGLYVSLSITLLVWATGIGCGSILGLISARYSKTIGILVQIIGAILTSIPVLVILFWLHYPLQAVLKVVIDPFITSVLALSLVNTFGVTGIVRNGLLDFPFHYIVAAKVCGLNRFNIAFKIVLPLIIKQLLPALLLLEVTMFQCTLFASLISVDEIFRVAQRVNAIVYRPIQIYSSLAILFLLVCLPLNALAYWLDKKYQVLLSDQ